VSNRTDHTERLLTIQSEFILHLTEHIQFRGILNQKIIIVKILDQTRLLSNKNSHACIMKRKNYDY